MNLNSILLNLIESISKQDKHIITTTDRKYLSNIPLWWYSECTQNNKIIHILVDVGGSSLGDVGGSSLVDGEVAAW